MKKNVLGEELGKLFLVGLEGTRLDERNRAVLERIRPGFVILFSRNYEDPEQLANFINEIADVLGYRPVVAIDQEGGRVLRLGAPFCQLPSPMACAATGDPFLVRRAVEALAAGMRAVGIDWDLAPVVDVNTNPRNPVIGTRSFGDDPVAVVTFAKAFLDGLYDAGVEGCLKHFPGIGAVSVDPHFDLPTLDLPFDELQETHLLPFVLVPAGAWMPTHVYVKGLQSSEVPASLSHEVLTELARSRLGFEGLLVADDLMMGGASRFSLADRLRLSFEAGMDVLTMCHDPSMQLTAFEEFSSWVAGNRTLRKRLEESLERVERFIGRIERLRANRRCGLESIGRFESRERMWEVAKRAVTLVSGELSDKLLKGIDIVVTMVPPKRSPVSDQQMPNVPKLAGLLTATTGARLHVLDAEGTCDVPDLRNRRIVFLSFNAHRNKKTVEILQELDDRNDLLLVALEEPYDAFLVRNSLATYGSLEIQQEAAFGVLMGEYEPQGRLPVSPPVRS